MLLAPVFERLGGSPGATSSSKRDAGAPLLAGGRGGGVAVLLTLAGEDGPVVRRGGGCIGGAFVGAGEALFVRLGAGRGGADDSVDAGGG